MPLEPENSMLHLFKTILDAIGVLYKTEKIEGPTTSITYLGIHLDTIQMFAAIPLAKRTELILTLRKWLTRAYCSLTELQSLIGSLMWVAQVAPHGRTFIQSLINRTKGKNRGSVRVKINKRCKDDIA